VKATFATAVLLAPTEDEKNEEKDNEIHLLGILR
jgi:hypothetical protein